MVASELRFFRCHSTASTTATAHTTSATTTITNVLLLLLALSSSEAEPVAFPSPRSASVGTRLAVGA